MRERKIHKIEWVKSARLSLYSPYEMVAAPLCNFDIESGWDLVEDWKLVTCKQCLRRDLKLTERDYNE